MAEPSEPSQDRTEADSCLFASCLKGSAAQGQVLRMQSMLTAGFPPGAGGGRGHVNRAPGCSVLEIVCGCILLLE